MDSHSFVFLMIIIVSLGFFALIFSIFYLQKREKMAMIERGMDPRIYKQQSAPFRYLKWACLLMGSGLGLFFANILDRTLMTAINHNGDQDNPAIYFSLIALFGGIGLFVSYLIEKKETVDKKGEE